MPKGIDEAGVYEALEAGAFFESETVGPGVFLGASQVKCRVCHIKIAATYHRFVLFEVLEIGEEAGVQSWRSARRLKSRLALGT